MLLTVCVIIGLTSQDNRSLLPIALNAMPIKSLSEFGNPLIALAAIYLGTAVRLIRE
jgi:hypothetical protein